MCGFTGFFSIKSAKKVSLVLEANKYSKFRGKDSSGIISLNFLNSPKGKFYKEDRQVLTDTSYKANLAIAHERLSIIDPSNNISQPMFMDNYILVFNGTIYNYKEIRDYLKREGLIFKTNTDTEVLLKAYIFWGIDSFKKLRGTWAAVIYDLNEKKITLSRDRFGEKPLYYCFFKNILYFSSSLISLSKLTNNKEIDIQTSRFFVKNGSTEFNEKTLIKEIFNLRPSHTIEFENNSIKKYKYWSINQNNDVKRKNDLSKILDNSVKSCLTADVEIACTLSGGLDSSNIFKRALKYQNIPAYTANTPDKDPLEEIKLARKVAENKKHIEIKIDKQIMKNSFLELTNFCDIPISLDSIIVDYFVNKKISKDGYRVVLNGHGADEIFLGYGSHLYASYLDRILKFDIKSMKENIIYLPGGLRKSIKSILKIFINLVSYFKIKIFDLFFLKKLSVLELLRIYQIETFPLYAWLQMADRTSMINNIEPRSPFLDPDLISNVLHFDLDIKHIRSNSKPILRSISKNLLPKEIYTKREKYGYLDTPSSDSKLTHDIILPTINSANKKLIKSISGKSKFQVINFWINYKLQNSWRVFSLLFWMNKYNIEYEKL